MTIPPSTIFSIKNLARKNGQNPNSSQYVNIPPALNPQTFLSDIKQAIARETPLSRNIPSKIAQSFMTGTQARTRKSPAGTKESKKPTIPNLAQRLDCGRFSAALARTKRIQAIWMPNSAPPLPNKNPENPQSAIANRQSP
jgi:hypothetical protein